MTRDVIPSWMPLILHISLRTSQPTSALFLSRLQPSFSAEFSPLFQPTPALFPLSPPEVPDPSGEMSRDARVQRRRPAPAQRPTMEALRVGPRQL